MSENRCLRYTKHNMGIYNLIDKYLLIPSADLCFGSTLSSQLRKLKADEFISQERIQEIQNEKLRRLIRHCYETVPYYHRLFDECGIKPEEIRNKEDLQRIPILTKQIIRENYDDLFCTTADPRQRKYASTGGSTGTPLKYCMDKREWSMQRASSFRAWESYGIHLGDKFFSLAGSSLTRKGQFLTSKGFYDRVIMRNHKYSSVNVDPESMEVLLQEFKRIRPKVVRGYGSSLVVFARYLDQVGFKPDTVQVVLTTGEVLLPTYRRELERVFHAPVYDAYGAGDGGIVSHECVNHRLHITEELCMIEITDKEGHVLPDGEIGYVTSTDLENYVFPFIRYHVGDMSCVSSEPCSCGRHTRHFGEIMGRAGRLVYNKQGVPISPTALPMMLYPDLDYHKTENQNLYNKIDKFQIRQDSEGNVQILLKLKDKAEENGQFNYILTNFENQFPGSEIGLSFVDEIPVLPSGKEDYCVSDYKRFE